MTRSCLTPSSRNLIFQGLITALELDQDRMGSRRGMSCEDRRSPDSQAAGSRVKNSLQLAKFEFIDN